MTDIAPAAPAASADPAPAAPTGAAALLGDVAPADGAPGAAGDVTQPPAPADGTPADGGDSGDGGARWWDDAGLSDAREGDRPSDADWLANKNFSSLADMVKSARALEGKLNEGRVALPKGPDDADGWAALATALGRPDSPEKMELTLPEGADPALVDGYRQAAFDMGLAPHQAQKMVDWFEGMAGEQGQANAERAGAELRGEWKADYDANIGHARSAMNALKLSMDDVNLMAAGYGLAPAMRLLAKIGRETGEDGGLFGTGRQGFGGQSIEQVQARRAEIMGDRALVAKLNAGDKVLKAEWDQLNAREAELMDAARRR